MRFSANLGFLWTELDLPEAIGAAAKAGFAAVECHWPFDTDPGAVRQALADAELPMVALNTWPGDRAAGEFGLAALPGREAEARAAISQALRYSRSVDARAVHVMGGVAEGASVGRVLAENLRFACAEAGELTVLIEPINRLDVPGYFPGSVDRALQVLEEVDAPNLKLMVDCYHLAQMGLDVVAELERLMSVMGHVQIAGHPGRGAPDSGTLDYGSVFAALERLGWDGFVGAEYRPGGATEDSLGWLSPNATDRGAVSRPRG
jgi:hydroxypyruvate isomerase